MKLKPRDTLVELLRTLNDVRLDQQGEGGDGGTSDDRLLLLSALYHEGTYAELEVCLKLMRRKPLGKGLLWHLRERYIDAERRPMLLLVANGKPVHDKNVAVTGGQAERGAREWLYPVEAWHPRVRMIKVERGLDLLEAIWWTRFDYQWTLPKEDFRLLSGVAA